MKHLKNAVIYSGPGQQEMVRERSEDQQRLYGIIESLPSPAFIIDRDHTILFWNKALEAQSGIKSLEVLGTSNHWRAFYPEKRPCLADLLVDEAFDRIPELYAGTYARSTFWQESHEVTDFFPRLKDGGRWLRLTGSVLRDTAGRVIGAIEVVEDITDLKRTSESLKFAEERYQNIFNNTDVGLYQVAPGGRVTEVNPAFARMFGCTSSREAQKSLVGIIPPIYSDTETSGASPGEKSSAELKDFEIRVRKKDGCVSSILHSVRVIRDDKGCAIRWEGQTRDVTEQRRLERCLYQSERDRLTILDAVSELVVLLDRDLKVIWSNKALNRHFNLRPGELNGKRCYESLHKRKRPCRICPALRVMESGRSCIVDNFTAHGRRWTLKAYPLRDEQGNLEGVMKVITDITEQRQTREELTQAMQLLKNTLERTIQAMSVAVETRDPYTAGHQRRVADLACAIASEMRLSRKQIDGIRMAAVIHDIGKICVPAEILTKPTGLTEIEFDLIKAHSQAGYEILKDIAFPWPIARVILEHHEKIDGSGYPNGLMGENILMESRVLTVADVVEAINSHRPYRPALGIDMALAEIMNNKGKYYDPDVVDACIRLFAEQRFELRPN